MRVWPRQTDRPYLASIFRPQHSFARWKNGCGQFPIMRPNLRWSRPKSCARKQSEKDGVGGGGKREGAGGGEEGTHSCPGEDIRVSFYSCYNLQGEREGVACLRTLGRVWTREVGSWLLDRDLTSQRTIPNEKMSTFSSYSSPLSISGAIQYGVPTTVILEYQRH